MIKSFHFLLKLLGGIIFFMSYSFSQEIQNKNFNKIVKSYTEKFKASLISIPELYKKTRDENLKIIVLDAREKEEYNVSHIKDAIHIGYDDFNLEETLKSLDKKSEIIVYCSIGYRSGDIADRINQAGFKSYNLYGGIFEWVNQGHKVYKSKSTETSKVHTYNESWSKWLFKGEKVY